MHTTFNNEPFEQKTEKFAFLLCCRDVLWINLLEHLEGETIFEERAATAEKRSISIVGSDGKLLSLFYVNDVMLISVNISLPFVLICIY